MAPILTSTFVWKLYLHVSTRVAYNIFSHQDLKILRAALRWGSVKSLQQIPQEEFGFTSDGKLKSSKYFEIHNKLMT